MAIVKHIKSRNTNYSVDIDNMYEFASSHCTDFKDLRDDEDIVINREWILSSLRIKNDKFKLRCNRRNCSRCGCPVPHGRPPYISR